MRAFLVASIPVLVLSANFAFAGSVSNSDLYQNGNSNGATINQTTGTGTASNSSRVYQGDTYLNDYNLSNNSVVNVTQIGGADTRTTSEIYQNDSGQNASVSQDARNGGSQTSKIWQFQGSGNSATVTQISAYATDDQQSYITQNGSGQVTVTQYGPSDYSSVTQTAGGNSGGGWTGGSAWVALGATVNQSGTSVNTSYVTQSAAYSSAGVTQNGTGGTNWSQAYQADGYYNDVQLYQTNSGGSNWSNISQGGGNWNGISLNQTASTSLSNLSGVAQNGSEDWALISQNGSGGTNTSQLNQNSGSNNTGLVYQTANGGTNWSNIDQGGGNGNYVYLSQTAASGVSNISHITQNGNSNQASVTQH